MKLWLVPVAVLGVVAVAAAASLWLHGPWAFLVFATVIVVGLGAAPVVFSVRTRGSEARQQASPKIDRKGDRW